MCGRGTPHIKGPRCTDCDVVLTIGANGQLKCWFEADYPNSPFHRRLAKPFYRQILALTLRTVGTIPEALLAA